LHSADFKEPLKSLQPNYKITSDGLIQFLVIKCKSFFIYHDKSVKTSTLYKASSIIKAMRCFIATTYHIIANYLLKQHQESEKQSHMGEPASNFSFQSASREFTRIVFR